MERRNNVPTQSVTIKLRQHKLTPAQQIPRQKKSGNTPARDLTHNFLYTVHGRRLDQFGHRFPRINRSVTSVLMNKLRRSWGQYKHNNTLDTDPRWYIPRFFLSEYIPCRSRFMLSKFNCNTLGWNTLPSFLYMIFSWPLYQAIDPQCVYMWLSTTNLP